MKLATLRLSACLIIIGAYALGPCETPQASAPISGQFPPIGIIDFYGLRTISEEQVRAALRIKEGEEVSQLVSGKAQKEAESRLVALPNVEQARLYLVCCEAGKAILYVGVREKGAPMLKFRAAPKGEAHLPETIVRAGKEFQDAVLEAVQKGDAGEDDSQGHARFNYPKLRVIQERYLAFAAQHLPRLLLVLHKSSDAEQRALAVQIIAYSTKKRTIVKDLVYGMHDPDPGVRNNSMRALEVLAVFAQNSPKRRIKIPVYPFVEMLNSIEWTDRNKSSLALGRLTANRDPTILSQLSRSALPSLVEMARWKSPGHALPSFTVLGRIGNFSENEIRKAWDSGDRESLIAVVLKTVGQGAEPSVSWQQQLAYRTTELHPIMIGKFGYPYVTVQINGHELSLAWDTGNMTGLALNSAVAARLNLPVVGESKSLDSSGEVIGLDHVFKVEVLTLFGQTWNDLRAYEIKTDDLDGLIGPRFVLGKRFTLDYQNKVIAISDTPLPSEAIEHAVVLPLIPSPQLKGMIVVRGIVNGKSVLIQVDTGKSRSCVDSSFVASEKLPEAHYGYFLKEVKLGPYSFSVRSARRESFRGISEGLPEPIMIGIGSDILSQVTMTVDYTRRVMVISK